MVPLADPEEIDDLAIQIVQHFNLGRLLVKEHLCAAREGFHVCRMLGEFFNNLPGQTVLAPNVCQWAFHVQNMKVR